MATPADKTILIVDDEPDVQRYFQRLLEDAGFTVVTASNGQEALESVQSKAPDFISLDLVMPEKSGIRFFHELRRNREWSRIPVVIVTAHASDEFGKQDINDIMQNTTVSGPELYLEKPVKPQHYVNTVKKILGLPTEDEVIEEEDVLRSELEGLVKGADAKKLQEALKALKDKPGN
jgi:CheY-like chemotaxis protein